MTYAVGHARLVDAGPAPAHRPDTPATVDPDDFEELFTAYAPRLRLIAERKLGDAHLAEDAVQETFLRAFRNLDSFDATRPALPWLTAICSNICIDQIRRRYASSEVLTEDADALGLEESPDLQPAEQFMARERARGMGSALGALCVRQKRVLTLKDLHGWRCEDIASLEGTSVQAVKGALKRARKSFKEGYLAIASERGLLSFVFPVAGWFAAQLKSKLRRAMTAGKASAGALGVQAITQAAVMSSIIGATAAALLVVGGVSLAGEEADARAPAAPVSGPAASVEEGLPDEVLGQDVVTLEVSTPPLGAEGPRAGVSAGIDRRGEETLWGKVESKVESRLGDTKIRSQIDARCSGTLKKAACDAVDRVPELP